MLRVFLVIDDYNELIYLQSLLKKIGFDVEGLQNIKKYHDVSLGFNPHILVTTARGKKVNGLALSLGINKQRGYPRIIALKGAEQNIPQQEFIDAGVDEILETPIVPKKLLILLAKLGGVDEDNLLEKYSKIKRLISAGGDDQHHIHSLDDNGQPIDEVHKVKKAIENIKENPNRQTVSEGGVDDSKLSTVNLTPEERERAEKFEKWARELGPLPNRHFDRQRILDFNKKIRQDNKVDDIEEIEAERKQYVRSLFRLAKSKS